MQPGEFDNLLRRMLEDQRLSRGEQQVLRSALAEKTLDEQQLALYRHKTFDMAREAISDGEARKVLDWLEDVVKILQPRTEKQIYTAEAYFSPGDNCPARIASLFDAAARKVDVCVFTITDDRITSAILAAQLRKIAIRVITDDEKIGDAGSDIERLREAGVPVCVDRSMYHMHHKFAIYDDTRLLTGSYNWTRGAADYNLENFLVTDDARLVDKYASVFEGIWKKLGGA